MTGHGHTQTGIGLSIAVYYLSYTTLSDVIDVRSFFQTFEHDFLITMFFSFLCAFVAISGATAPDWLEIRKKSGGTVIPHRTITHWVLLWIIALFCGFYFTQFSFVQENMFESFPYLTTVIGMIIISFSLGGILHLITDFPNKMGIPIFFYNKRYCLSIWKSGKNEQFLITMTYVSSILYIGLDTEIVKIDLDKMFYLLGIA